MAGPKNASLAESANNLGLNETLEEVGHDWADEAETIVLNAGLVLKKKAVERQGIDLRIADDKGLMNIGVFDPTDGPFGRMTAEPRIVIHDLTGLSDEAWEAYMVRAREENLPTIANTGEVGRAGMKEQNDARREFSGVLGDTTAFAAFVFHFKPDFCEIQDHQDIVKKGEMIQHYLTVEKALRKTFSDSPDYIEAKEWLLMNKVATKAYKASQKWLEKNSVRVQKKEETYGRVAHSIRRAIFINGAIINAAISPEYQALMDKYVDRDETGKVITTLNTARWQGREQYAKNDALIIEYPEGSEFFFLANGRKRVRIPPDPECERVKREFMDKAIMNAVAEDFPEGLPEGWRKITGYPYITPPPAGCSSTTITEWSHAMRLNDYKQGEAINSLIKDIRKDTKAKKAKRGDAFTKLIRWVATSVRGET